VHHRGGRPDLCLNRLLLGVLPQQLRCRGVLEVLGQRERRAAVGGLPRGVGLGVEQRLHDRSVAVDSSTYQGGLAEGGLQVDARAALQQHLHHRLLPSQGGRHQQRRIVALCAARVHAAALVQPRDHGLGIVLLRGRAPHGFGQPRLLLVS